MDNDNVLTPDKSYQDRRVDVINKWGFTNLKHIGGGNFSDVFTANPTNTDVRDLFGNTTIIKSGNSNAPERGIMLRQEFDILKDLRDIQSTAGTETCTPIPIMYIMDGDIRAIAMTEAQGKKLNEINYPIDTISALSLIIQESNLFTLLENTDSVRKDNFVTMKDFQLGENTFVNTQTSLPKLEMIDWSLRTSKMELNDSRINERLHVAATLTRFLLGPKRSIRFENQNDRQKSRSDDFIEDVNNLINDPEFKQLDSAIIHVITKGLGLQKDFPDGYNSHDEMLGDLLAVAKKLKLSEDSIPPNLRERYSTTSPANFNENKVEKQEVRPTEKRPIAKVVNGVHMSMLINTPPTYWGGNYLLAQDGVSKPGSYTGSEIAEFCANATIDDYDPNDKEAPIKVGIGRILTAQYYLKKIFSPQLNFFGSDDEIAQTTLGKVQAETNNSIPKLEVINKCIMVTIRYWETNKDKLSSTRNMDTDQLKKTSEYFEKLKSELK